MSDAPPSQTREQRLAAQLRANLHRRKAQARALESGTAAEAKSPLCKDRPDR